MPGEAEILARLAAIEQQNQQVLAMLASLAAPTIGTSPHTVRRAGKYTLEQYREMVKNPKTTLREMSKQDTARRRKAKKLEAAT